jgi:hypothetical protein
VDILTKINEGKFKSKILVGEKKKKIDIRQMEDSGE